MADVMPSANVIDWASYSGVPGGIPNRTTVFATHAAGTSASTINSSIASCPSGQVVKLGSGTFNLGGSRLIITKSGVTVRGAVDANGMPTTVLTNGNGWGWLTIAKSDSAYSDNDSTFSSHTTRTISAGASHGSTQVTLNAVTGLSVGDLMCIDALPDENIVIAQNSVEGRNNWYRNNTDRVYCCWVRVTNIAGNDVSFTPPLLGTFWGSMSSVGCFYGGSATVGPSDAPDLSGFENIQLPNSTAGTNRVAIGPAQRCWVKNVRSTNCVIAHVRLHETLQCEIRECWHDTHNNVASATYTNFVSYSSYPRIENNIYVNIPCAVGFLGTSGGVIAYNDCETFPYSSASWLPECMMIGHDGHCEYNLVEGNHVPSLWADMTHGNHSYNSFVRNRLRGWETGKTSNTQCINIQDLSTFVNRNYAALGNVLGTDAYHSSQGDMHNVETNSNATYTKKGNYNTVTDGIPAGEALGADTISNSYLYAAKPSWWGVSQPWPAITPTNFSQSDNRQNIPAGYRRANGAWPAAGGSVPDAPTNFRRTS